MVVRFAVPLLPAAVFAEPAEVEADLAGTFLAAAGFVDLVFAVPFAVLAEALTTPLVGLRRVVRFFAEEVVLAAIVAQCRAKGITDSNTLHHEVLCHCRMQVDHSSPIATVLDRLEVTHFRNLGAQTFAFGPGVHFISGHNGAGKTNVLDAIYYLCLTRSHFSYGDASAVAHDASWLRLVGSFTLGGKTERIALKMHGRKGKTLERNGVAYGALAEHIGLLPAVMISPSDIQLVVGGPEERRRYIDQTIAQYDPQYLKTLMAYNRLVKSRNAVLKSAAHPLEVDLGLLATYDRQLEQPALRIVAARRQYVADLQPVFAQLYAAICDDRELPGLEYATKVGERPYAELLMASRDTDFVLRRTNVGPHRDELSMSLNGEGLRKFASQGQLKTFVLALRLAQARLLRNRKLKAPLLLLDDLFDRLDPGRVQRLVNLVLDEGYEQVFITDTHDERLAAIEVGDAAATHHRILAGELVSPQESVKS